MPTLRPALATAEIGIVTQFPTEFQREIPTLSPNIAPATISSSSYLSVTATGNRPSLGPLPVREDHKTPTLHRFQEVRQFLWLTLLLLAMVDLRYGGPSLRRTRTIARSAFYAL